MRTLRPAMPVLLLIVLGMFTAACDGDSDRPPTPTVTATPSLTPTTTPTETPRPLKPTTFLSPLETQLSLSEEVEVRIQFDPSVSLEMLEARLDGDPVTESLEATGDGEARVTLVNLPAENHRLVAEARLGDQTSRAEVNFETVDLANPDECEVLNAVECMLPYPSSRFLEAADTPTGLAVRFPQAGMPEQNGRRLPIEPYEVLDGFSPTVQILMHFPAGVDPVASDASRLLPTTRTYDLRSLDPDSPTLLFDANTGEQLIHFVEVDARAEIKNRVDRQLLFLRPGKSLTPGHRYMVAVRNLVDREGGAVEPEAVFAALRDGRPTDISAVEARRNHMNQLFDELTALGVQRDELILAFDFTVQSEDGLTTQMLSMRDQGFAWLAERQAAREQTFRVETVVDNDCEAGASMWRRVEGTYDVPLFLEADPVTMPNTIARLNVDGNGTPVQNGLTTPPFTIAIPCSVLDEDGAVAHPIVLGHGLFGDGRGFVKDLWDGELGTSGFDYIAGATDWRGLSSPDRAGALTTSFIGQIALQLGNLPALPDRLRQGQLNTLVLARMMKSGAFNADSAFQTPDGKGVFPGAETEQFYFGASLGGIMGLMFAALSPDVTNVHVDVPGINFSLLLSRATPFLIFEAALELTGLSDAIDQILAIGIVHELWVRGESAGYATHITSNPLPGTNVKSILMTGALFDQQVSNQATEIAARTLGLPSLIGSVQPNLPQIQDLQGPLPSALVMYDTGSFDPSNSAHEPSIPPMANLQARPNDCDPHGLQAVIPAALDQMREFLKPGGEVVNFCDGLCDAAEPIELPFGQDLPCDPLG